jgi:hypothetical protein
MMLCTLELEIVTSQPLQLLVKSMQFHFWNHGCAVEDSYVGDVGLEVEE